MLHSTKLMRARVVLLLALALLSAACTPQARGGALSALPSSVPPQSAATGAATPSAPAAPALVLPAGFRAEVYADGLRQPTALAFGGDGRLYIAQLGGGENAGVGQVVVLDGARAAPRTVLDGLLKPTGLVWRGDDLYIAAGRDVLRVRLAGDGALTPPHVIVRDLPFNTRSEGQITLLPDARLLFEASGLVGDPQSGRLLTLAAGGAPQVLAQGLKNAYAHARDPASGRIYTTDIGDDPVDGAAPPEEINVVEPGGDYGWPGCYGAQRAAADRGATAATCAATRAPVLTFPPHSTPTGLTFYAGTDFPPAYRGVLYVALWNGSPPQVVRVTLSEQAGRVVGVAAPFIDGLQNPIALLPDPRGGLLVLDHTAGVLYRISAVK